MNNDWINNSIAEYYNWLRDRTQVSRDDSTGWYAITTPFSGLFNDMIEIYVKMEKEKIFLSDDGQTLSNLELSGVSIPRSSKRKEWLDMILLSYGITMNENELQTEGTKKDFSQKKHNLISAISEISEMTISAEHTVSSLFREDVKNFLDERGIIYTQQFIAKGSTGIEFTFDFQIAGKQKELVIKAFDSVNKSNVPNFLFGWTDIKPAREKISGKELMATAIINNTNKRDKPEFISALRSKGANTLMWDKREQPGELYKLAA
jgi:hypothetical protein